MSNINSLTSSYASALNLVATCEPLQNLLREAWCWRQRYIYKQSQEQWGTYTSCNKCHDCNWHHAHCFEGQSGLYNEFIAYFDSYMVTITLLSSWCPLRLWFGHATTNWLNKKRKCVLGTWSDGSSMSAASVMELSSLSHPTGLRKNLQIGDNGCVFHHCSLTLAASHLNYSLIAISWHLIIW